MALDLPRLAAHAALLAVVISTGQAQPNLVPNWSFEEGQDGKAPKCNDGYSYGVWRDFDKDIANWRIAHPHPNSGGQCSPDWEDTLDCPAYTGYTDPDYRGVTHWPSGRFVTVGENQTWHEGVRVGLTKRLKGGQKYTMRLKLCAVSSSFDANPPLNGLRVHLTTWGEHWNSDKKDNAKQTDVTSFGLDCTQPGTTWRKFYSQQRDFVVDGDKDNTLGNLILVQQVGGMLIDDVELYERGCEDDLYIENRSYRYDEFPYESAKLVMAGRNVDASQTDGDVVALAGANVTYKAGQHVRLMPGFSAKSGSHFQAYILPCDVYR